MCLEIGGIATFVCERSWQNEKLSREVGHTTTILKFYLISVILCVIELVLKVKLLLLDLIKLYIQSSPQTITKKSLLRNLDALTRKYQL